MSMIRWNPNRELANFRRSFGRLFNEWDDEAPTRTSFWKPAVDIFETKDSLVMKVELPGVNKEDVKIDLDNQILTLSGERKFDHEVKEDDYHRIERAYGQFQRSFTLPNKIDAERIEAHYRDGMLEVVLPKKEEAKPRQININVK